MNFAKGSVEKRPGYADCGGPTSFNTVTEEEFAQRGINIVIYANQLTRQRVPAMQKAARTILENHRAKEADDLCMPIKDILTLIPEEA